MRFIELNDDMKEVLVHRYENHKSATVRKRVQALILSSQYRTINDIILIYNADNFLSFAKEKGLLPKLKKETIEEVKKVRVSDEKRYTDISAILKAQNLAMQNAKDVFTTYQPLDMSAFLDVQTLMNRISGKKQKTNNDSKSKDKSQNDKSSE